MRSSGSLKPFFSKGELVLCYEPDPTKIRLLYDARIVDIIVYKKNRLIKEIGYRIHFLGWKYTWDTLVPEEFIMSVNKENRNLQKKLTKDLELIIDQNSNRKQKVIKRSDDTNFKNLDSNDSIIKKPNTELNPRRFLNEFLCNVLERDYRFINVQKKALKIPAKPNIIQILESYYNNYLSKQLSDLEKTQSNIKNLLNGVQQLSTQSRFELMLNNVRICKEIIDSLRISFDFYFTDNLLLYDIEKQRHTYSVCPAFYSIQQENDLNSRICNNEPKTKKIRLSSKYQKNNKIKDKMIFVNFTKPEKHKSILDDTSFKLLPEYVYEQDPPPPSLIFGVVHLARLFVKLPETLLYNIPNSQTKIIDKYISDIVRFLSEHNEWFDEKIYIK